jgi:hypothetical protein
MELCRNLTSYFNADLKSIFDPEHHIKTSALSATYPNLDIYKVNNEHQELLLSYLPSKLIEAERAFNNGYIQPIVIQYNARDLSFHTDDGRATALNWHYAGGDGITSVLEPEDLTKFTAGPLGILGEEVKKITGHHFASGGYQCPTKNKITYTTKDNDVWLLDVSKPHSVANMHDDKRLTVSFSFCLPYHEVVKCF